MAGKVHEVGDYNYSFDARAGGPGRLQLWGARGNIAEVRFVADDSPVPDPVVSPDLERATFYLKGSALRGLVAALRNERVGVVIEDYGDVFIRRINGLTESVVICSTCSDELRDAKSRGIEAAMRGLIDFCGADALPEICPITFHLDGDGYCGPYVAGTSTGAFGLDADGLGHVCLWDVEKENRSIPFTLENAETIQDQGLAVHEAMHGWFRGRQRSYRVQEPFCKLVSFVVSELPGGPEYCDWFANTPDGHPDMLMKHLCEIGMTTHRASQTLQRLAAAAAESGGPLSDADFAGIVSAVLGVDAVPAFEAAGILP